jgi:hypothetical protein
VLIVCVAIVSLGWTRQGDSIRVVGGTPDQREMTRWAVSRFEAAGLSPPPVEVRFHLDRDPCRGHLGYYDHGVVHVCRRHTDLWASRELLHEMAHGWLHTNLTAVERARFLKLRGLITWNDAGVAWDERGFEQGAEIIAWAIGDQADGIYMPSIPDNAPRQLAEAYRVLTSDPFPTLAPAALWAKPRP